MSKSTLHIAHAHYAIDDARSIVERIDGSIPVFDIRKIADNEYSVVIDGQSCHVFMTRINDTIYATIQNAIIEITHETLRDRLVKQTHTGTKTEATSVSMRAPMPGMIVKIIAAEGSEVQPGDGILVVEAMKMENEIKAPKAGILKKIFVVEKQSIEKNDQLFTIEYL